MRAVVLLLAVCGCQLAWSSRFVPGASFVEGHVRNARTGEPLVGMRVWLGGPCSREVRSMAISDETGYFRLELGSGRCEIYASYGGTASSRTVRFDAARHRAVVVELAIDSAKLAAALRTDPPLRCPSSPVGAIIEGWRPSPTDRDALAQAVLERYVANPRSLAEHIAPENGIVMVDAELSDGRGQLTEAALPTAAGSPLVLQPAHALQAEADRRRRRVQAIRFDEIYSDGSCAIVTVGGAVIRRRDADPFTWWCTCSATELFEKRAGVWQFVRRHLATCGG
jgi:hypothetical protein